MKNILKKIFDAVAFPFVALAVHIDESMRINEDGSWDRYNRKKNRKAQKRRTRECRQ